MQHFSDRSVASRAADIRDKMAPSPAVPDGMGECTLPWQHIVTDSLHRVSRGSENQVGNAGDRVFQTKLTSGYF